VSYADLIERLEKLEGPDSKANVEIHRACGQPFVMEYWSESDTTPSENLSMVPRYTASLDAAVALVGRVLPGWQWRVSAYQGEVFQRDPEFGQDAFHATPAIALLIATLKALEQQHD
jgi:hypothetical protein